MQGPPMDGADEHPVDRGARRVVGAILGLVFGLVIGLLVALFVIGFGDAFLVTVALFTVGTAVLAFLYPAPFHVVGGILLSLVGIEI